MKLIAISDLHGHLPTIEHADILFIVGDIIPRPYKHNIAKQWEWYNSHFLPWLESLPHPRIIWVAGNHDKFVKHHGIISTNRVIYLENSGIEIDGLKVWGTPNISRRVDESNKLHRLFGKIPTRLDVLLSHSPPYGVCGTGEMAGTGIDIGSSELTKAIKDSQIRYIFCGHSHSGNRSLSLWRGKRIANVAHCNSQREPTGHYLVVEI